MSALNRSIGLSVLVPATLVACAPSVQQEVDMGNQYAQELEQTLPMIRDAGAVSSFRASMAPLQRVAQRQDLTWNFSIVNSDQVNAFAVPGGHVYVFRGLIERAQHYDEFAGAMAHEIAHVDLRHSASQMGSANAANIGISLAYLLLGRQPGQAEQAGIGLAGNIAFAKFSRDDEREADSVAVRMLTQANIDPGGMTRMFQILQSLGQRDPGKVELWFSSHPGAGERIENSQRIIASTPGAAAATRNGRSDLAAFQDLQRRLRAMPAAPKEVAPN